MSFLLCSLSRPSKNRLFCYKIVRNSVRLAFSGKHEHAKFFYGTRIRTSILTSGTENRGKGNSAKGKEEQKPVTTVALDRVCVRVWRRHVWPCMCACICQVNVYVKEKMCMHTAVRCWQLSKNKTMPWLNYGGGGGLCKVESLKSAEKWQCSSVFKMESRKLPPCSTEAMVGRPKDRQRELRSDKVHCRAVRLGPLVSKARCQPLDEVLPFTLQNSVRGDDEGSESAIGTVLYTLTTATNFNAAA